MFFFPFSFSAKCFYWGLARVLFCLFLFFFVFGYVFFFFELTLCVVQLRTHLALVWRNWSEVYVFYWALPLGGSAHVFVFSFLFLSFFLRQKRAAGSTALLAVQLRKHLESGVKKLLNIIIFSFSVKCFYCAQPLSVACFRLHFFFFLFFGCW